MFEGVSRRRAVAWALYDAGNSAFATTVMAAFFPAFFKAYWAEGADATESTFWLGVANSTGSIVVALLAPALGAVADAGGVRKRFLTFFAFLGAAQTAALFLVEAGAWPLAALLYVVAVVGFSGGNIFYDALLVAVAPPKKMDVVSALGYAAGYLGGGVLFAVQVYAYQSPATFGLSDPATAIRVSFLSVGLWWLLLTVPLLLWVPEPPAASGVRGLRLVGQGFRQLATTFRHARLLRHTFLFLVAYWLYIDGVDTVVRMAVDYGLSLGLPESTPI
ncbi:MAG: MFS transporter, partial [Deltaproteobacteria bacterium]